MLYQALFHFADNVSFLNVFRYITFRSALALFTSFLVVFFIMEPFIRYMKKHHPQGQPIRDDGPETHFAKKGTPTMGGLIILISILVSTLLWADLGNTFVLATLLVMSAFGVLGFVDDYQKLKHKNSKGISGKTKLLTQLLVGGIASFIFARYTHTDIATTLALPFFKNFTLHLGFLYIVFGAFVITGASNAVNLTDGLDGLATGPIIITAACFGLISYLAGNAIFANYLKIFHIAGTGELMILLCALVGAGLGFLWYNASPASIIMGDVGSLAIGGVLGAASVATKHEILLAIIGGVFVMEALSVIIQVASFKSRGKRVFKMAPLHHHFEKGGWSETKVVARFWILSIIFALIGLITLKLR